MYQLIYSLDNANHTFSGIDVLVRSRAAGEVSVVGTRAPVRAQPARLQGGRTPLGAASWSRRSQPAISAPQAGGRGAQGAGVGVRTEGERLWGPGGQDGCGIRARPSSAELSTVPFVREAPECGQSAPRCFLCSLSVLGVEYGGWRPGDVNTFQKQVKSPKPRKVSSGLWFPGAVTPAGG